MSPRRRIRKTVKWGGAAVFVLLAVVWVCSGRYGMFLGALLGWCGAVDEGAVYIWRALPGERSSWLPSLPRRGTGQGSSDRALRFSWTFQGSGKYFAKSGIYAATAARVPLWAPATLVMLITLPAWALDHRDGRRARMNLCSKCAYSRAGLAPDGVCPECGSPASNETAVAR